MRITKITPLESDTCRVFTENEVVFDLYTPLLECQEGDVLHFEYSETPIKYSGSGFVMAGTVYYKDTSCICASCGGLLIRIPDTNLQPRTTIYILISKSSESFKSKNRKPASDSKIVKKRKSETLLEVV